MSEEAITALLHDAAFAFVGTVEQVGAATMDGLPIDEQTLVVHVDQVLHAPDAFAALAGSVVTLQAVAGEAALAVNDSQAFFATGLAFAESVALLEVGRLPIDAVEPHVTSAAADGAAHPLHALHTRVVEGRLRSHAGDADVIVLGRVDGLQKVTGPPLREHDPDWWLATIHVVHAEKGNVAEGDVKVLYANSLDVRWREVPKPKAAQNGLWILHATSGKLTELAPYQLMHAEDFQPPQALESLRDPQG